jgi:OFA family oxalate/formate antiporter-like MFS transporter
MSDPVSAPSGGNRWGVAIAGTGLQLCLGTVYAWSFFQKPLMTAYGWSNKEAALAFSLAICFLGIAAAVGGINLARFGPRKLAVTGAVLFGLGYVIAAFALKQNSLWLLYLGYGVIGGTGLGLGYVTPVATAAKWFPDKKGLVTGMVVMGFGFGALLMSMVCAPWLLRVTGGNMAAVFAWLGVSLGGLALIAACFLRNPPAGFVPAGWTPPAARAGAAAGATEYCESPVRCILSARFAMLWVMFFCNITAGIAIIGFQSPLIQDLYRKLDTTLDAKVLAGYGAALIAVSSIFNGIGRFFWGGLSDRIGRAQAFRALLGTQIVAFVALMFTGNPWLFGGLICYVLLCYGGGFGTMPSFIGDVFGPKMMPVVYGTILTAWSAAGLAGPMIVGYFKDHYKEQASQYSFIAGAVFLAVGLAMALMAGNDPHRGEAG